MDPSKPRRARARARLGEEGGGALTRTRCPHFFTRLTLLYVPPPHTPSSLLTPQHSSPLFSLLTPHHPSTLPTRPPLLLIPLLVIYPAHPFSLFLLTPSHPSTLHLTFLTPDHPSTPPYPNTLSHPSHSSSPYLNTQTHS